MKKILSAALAVIAAALLITACSSEESHSELDNLINSLQTSNLPPETEPEETADTEGTENTEEATESSDNSPAVVYSSLTGTILSAEGNIFTVEFNGIRYDILISENTEIFGGTLSEEKTVTVTYASSEDADGITAIAITILQSESSDQE